MTTLDLLSQYSISKANDQNQGQLINMYLEEEQTTRLSQYPYKAFPDSPKGEYKVIAMPTFGLMTFCDTLESNVRTMYEHNEVLYVVAGNHFYSVNSSGITTQIATISTSSGFAKIAVITGADDSNNQIFIIDGTHGYSYNTTSGIFSILVIDTYVLSGSVLNPGSNYTNPVLTITDATGTGATASATVNAGRGVISYAAIIQGGSGYVAPTVVFTDSTGTGASATVTVANGALQTLTIQSGGQNYSSNCVVSFSGPGTGATAVARVTGGEITGISIDTPGTNYTAPVLTITDATGVSASGSLLTGSSNFPDTATDIAAQDDYVIVEDAGSIHFNISNVANSKTWAALDFASKLRKADKLVALTSYKGELYLFGSKTTEVWQNTGNADFPFERRSDLFIEMGCAAQKSVVQGADSLYFLSKSLTGGYGFITLKSGSPENMATKDVMSKLCSLTTVSDCIGYSYAKDGHEFIDWTFPTDNFTFTYDMSNDTWVIRQSYLNSTYGRFLGNCHAFCYGKSLIGDFNSGKIYQQRRSIYTENGVAIKRQFVSPYVYVEGKRVFAERLQIDVQTNVGIGTFLLEMTTDRGATWETIDTYTIPTSGSGSIYTTSLGSAFSYAFRITCTDDVNFIILGFQANFTVGEN